MFALTNGSRHLIGFLLDAITSESGSGGTTQYTLRCSCDEWNNKNLEDVVVVADGPGSAQSLSNGECISPFVKICFCFASPNFEGSSNVNSVPGSGPGTES